MTAATSNTRTVQRGEQLGQKIKLAHITVSHNPRRPCPNLQDQGIDPTELAKSYGLSSDPNKRAYYVEQMEKHEAEIVDLASSIHGEIQIQPIRVRDFRVKNPNTGEYAVRYGIAAGERRYLACVYNYAKHGGNDTIIAIVKKMTVEQAYWIGVQENLQRREMEEWEIGQIFQKWAEANGTGGKPASFKAVAEHFKREYQYVRGRMALCNLSEERMKKLKDGKIGLTAAIKEGLGEVEEGGSKPSKAGKRHTPLSLKEMKALFDRTPAEQEEIRRIIAQCMRVDYDEALAESNERVKEEQEKQARQQLRQAS